jgi:hypothetical protein
VRARAVLALVLTAGLAAGGTAVAAPKPKPKPKPKPVCNVATDAKGDTFAARVQDTQGGPFGPHDDGLDIVSADLASDGKVITGVVRVVSMAPASTSPGGRGFDINIATPRSPAEVYLRASVPASGAPTAEAGTREALPAVTSVSTPLGAGTAVVDTAKNEVRFSFPTSIFESVGGIKVGDTLSFGEITVGRTLGPRSVFADVAVPGTSYKVGTPTCVPLGK